MAKQHFNFPFFVSKRYIRSRRAISAININTIISVLGVAVGTMALVVVLSVFNGFDGLIKSLFNSFDPDLKVTVVEGKTFVADSLQILKIESLPGVESVALAIEENALLQYNNKQYIATLKGVTPNFDKVSGIRSRMVDGKYLLQNGTMPYAVVGQGVAYYLGIGVGMSEAIVVFVPKRTAELSNNPTDAFNRKFIIPAGVFSIEQDFDSKYLLVPIGFMRDLLEYTNEVTAVEIKLRQGFSADAVQQQVKGITGTALQVKNRYQQQEFFYKIMKSEKWAIFFILTFIILVASLNIISSLTMIILDKKRDITVFNFLGAEWKTIRRIFIYDGWMVSMIGAILGILLGLLVCWLQMRYGIVKLQGSGSFIIDAYPVKVMVSDVLLVFASVAAIGFAASLIPARVISRKYFEAE